MAEPAWEPPPPPPKLCRRLSGRLLWTSVSPPVNGWLTRSLRLTPENFRRGHTGGVRSPSRCGLVRFSFLQHNRPRNEESEDLALVSPGRALPVSSLCPFPCVSPCEDRDHVVAHAYSPSDRASGTCPWRFGGTKEGPGQDRVVAAEGASQVKREGKQWGVGSLEDWFTGPLLNCHLKNSSSCSIRITAAPGNLDLDSAHYQSGRATQSQAPCTPGPWLPHCEWGWWGVGGVGCVVSEARGSLRS